MSDFFWDDEDGTRSAVKTQKHLIDTQERMGALLDLLPNVIPMGLLIHQPQAMLFVNKETCRMFETTHTEMLGRHLLDFVTDDLRDKLLPVFMKAFHDEKAINISEIELQTHSGKTHIVNLSIGKLPWEGQNCVQIVLQDVTELIQKERELIRLTMTDPLTGAYNRRYFLKQSQKAIEKATMANEDVCLIIFDLDHFKKINDTFGHKAGDLVLEKVVEVWESNSRKLNFNDQRDNDSHLARIGGEEFAVLLRKTTIDEASVIAERIRLLLTENSITYQEHTIRYSGSFGLTAYKSGETLDDMFRRADQALYESKFNGRNRITIKL